MNLFDKIFGSLIKRFYLYIIIKKGKYENI